MKTYKIHLPTKPYLARYLTAIYGQHITIDPSTDLGDIIITKLSSTLHCTMDKHDIDVRLNRLTDRVTFHIPIHWWYKLGNKELTQHQVIRLNRYFENKFECDLQQVVHRAHTWLGIDRQIAIKCFALNHGIVIERDISFEGLKKMEYRYRTQLQPKITENIVHGLSKQMQLFAVA
jgi:hypothetical protein